jgi:hypothetical protein
MNYTHAAELLTEDWTGRSCRDCYHTITDGPLPQGIGHDAEVALLRKHLARKLAHMPPGAMAREAASAAVREAADVVSLAEAAARVAAAGVAADALSLAAARATAVREAAEAVPLVEAAARMAAVRDAADAVSLAEATAI